MLAHEVHGREGGETVTLLHGFMQDRSSWAEVIDLLPVGFRWLLVDLPGHGGAATEPATMAEASGALVGLWEHLGIGRTHLVGYSLGGRLGLFTTVHHPERIASLLTLGAHAGYEGAERERRRRDDVVLADRVVAQGIEWFADYWRALPLFASLARRGPDLLERLGQMRRRQDALGIAASLRGMGGAAIPPFWDRLAAIACPSTFAAGVEDGRYVELARRLQGAVPGSCVALIPAAGHAAHLEQPEDFARILERHLSSP